MLKRIIHLFILFICVGLLSCKKFLDKKPDQSLAIPSSISDFQRMMDNPVLIETVSCGLGDVGCDDYFLLPGDYDNREKQERNSYIWAKDIFEQDISYDWNSGYGAIYICNVVLDGLQKFQPANAAEETAAKNIKGHALFVRAFLNYFLEETFGQPYRPASATTDLGIPLKLSSDLTEPVTRSTVAVVYNQIIADLQASANLLPTTLVPPYNRPYTGAAISMMARVYLTMQQYEKAADYANRALAINGVLFNINRDPLPGTNFNPAGIKPFTIFAHPKNHPELYYPGSQSLYSTAQLTTRIDTVLVDMYHADDLRKTAFLRLIALNPNRYSYKGTYTGIAPFASGPAVDEMYLIRAETSARSGLKDSAVADVKRLLTKRWLNTATLPVVTATDADSALRLVLKERRKELIFRGLRWIDLRRLNQDPRFADTLRREIRGVIYKLPPNDPRYTYPIPPDEIRLTGIQQNPR